MTSRFTYEIIQDDDPPHPRKEFDNVGTMVCWHRRYNLGDEQPKLDPEEYLDRLARKAVSENYPEALLQANRASILEKHYLILPLYLYDHSGITMNTTGFSCPWDSGQVGLIYCTKEQIQDEWDGDWEKARAYLKGEVKEYDQYLTGQVYGYVVKDGEGEEVESCWGFFGYEYCEEEAKRVVDHLEATTPKQEDMFC